MVCRGEIGVLLVDENEANSCTLRNMDTSDNFTNRKINATVNDFWSLNCEVETVYKGNTTGRSRLFGALRRRMVGCGNLPLVPISIICIISSRRNCFLC